MAALLNLLIQIKEPNITPMIQETVWANNISNSVEFEPKDAGQCGQNSQETQDKCAGWGAYGVV